jgi:hypothetical protein
VSFCFWSKALQSALDVTCYSTVKLSLIRNASSPLTTGKTGFIVRPISVSYQQSVDDYATFQ